MNGEVLVILVIIIGLSVSVGSFTAIRYYSRKACNGELNTLLELDKRLKRHADRVRSLHMKGHP